MIRIALYCAGVLALIVGLHWLANRPGTITIEWLDHVAEISMLGGLVGLAALLAATLIAWSILRRV